MYFHSHFRVLRFLVCRVFAFDQEQISETCSIIFLPEIHCVINPSGLTSILEQMRSPYRLGGLARYIEKPNKSAVENAKANPPIQILRMLDPTM